jgi:hypothetical protein
MEFEAPWNYMSWVAIMMKRSWGNMRWTMMDRSPHELMMW